VIVNDAFARENQIQIGDWIHLILNNRRQELFVVGTAISCEYVYLVNPSTIAPDPKHFGVFYLKRSFAEEIFDMDGACNQLVGTLAPEVRDRPDEVLRRIETVLEPYGVFTTIPLEHQPSNRFLSDEIRGIGVFSNIMPTIFLAVAALVLNVLMVRLIDQQRTLIGTFKAIGYTDRQIFWHFTKFGFALALGGGLIGLMAGYGMSELVTSIYRMFYEFPDLSNQIYPGVYSVGLSIALLCALIGSLHGARGALALRPAEAMRPKPPARGGAIWLERIGWLWKRLSFGWRLTLRNIMRHRLRTSVGVFAAAMGSGLLVTGFILAGALSFMIDFQFQKISRSDLDLNFADEQGLPALLEAKRLPGVDHAEPILDVSCTFVHGSHRKRGGITGLLPDARLTTPRDQQGQQVPIPAQGLAMSRAMANNLRVAPGAVVTVRPVKGRRDELRMPVVSIVDTYIGLAVYADIHYLSRLIGEDLAMSGVQVTIDPTRQSRHALYRELKQLPALRAIGTRGEVIANLQKIVEVQRIFINLICVFAGVIFLSSLLNTSLIGLAERRREVATLRVLGYTEWQVGGLFLRESMTINFIGTLLGLPLGWTLANYLAIVYNTDMFRFPLVTPPSIWFWVIGLGFAFAMIAHAIVQRAINKLDWLDASKTKE
jgi:putative ABC transport system permease protein